MPLAVGSQIRDARHRSVVVHHFADDAGGLQAGELRQVDGGLGLARSLEHAAGTGLEREDVSRLHEVVRSVERGSIATWIVRARSCAEIPVETPSRASTETVKAVLCGVSFRSVICRSSQLPAALRGEAQADQASAVGRHEVDRLGGRELGGDRQITFVLAVFVVHDDDEPPRANVLERLLDRRERACRGLHHELGHPAQS